MCLDDIVKKNDKSTIFTKIDNTSIRDSKKAEFNEMVNKINNGWVALRVDINKGKITRERVTFRHCITDTK
jgi:hypothetical protein